MIARIASLLWGPFPILLLTAAGLVFGVGTGFFVLRHPLILLRETVGSLLRTDADAQAISPFEALCTALAGTLGTGNMAGTAAAIALGGPGAVFWMMVCALLGMMTKAAECTLAVCFRERQADGSFAGGAMYYMRDGLGGIWRIAAVGFAAAMAVSALGTTAVQPYTMAAAVRTAFGVPEGITILIAVALCARVLVRGAQGAARFCAWMTPLLCLAYVGACVIALVVHREEIFPALALILRGAFCPDAVGGAAAGITLRRTIAVGFSKSTFTHEAGMGSAAMVHAAADVRHPAAQGMLGAAEVFVDTLVVCGLTALVILTAGESVRQSGDAGIGMTMAAFRATFGRFGDALIAGCCALFAFSTMVGWSFEFETSMRWLFGAHPMLYRALYLLPPLFIIGRSSDAVWSIVDLCTGIVTVPNVIAILLLSEVYFDSFAAYRALILPKSPRARRRPLHHPRRIPRRAR